MLIQTIVIGVLHLLSRTTITAIRALQYIALESSGRRVSPREVAVRLGESPSYMSKIARELVKAGILHAERGAKGGAYLARDPGEITLLQIVEACQGEVVGRFCKDVRNPSATCSFHQAAFELHQAIHSILSGWTLRQLLARPVGADDASVSCLMASR